MKRFVIAWGLVTVLLYVVFRMGGIDLRENTAALLLLLSLATWAPIAVTGGAAWAYLEKRTLGCSSYVLLLLILGPLGIFSQWGVSEILGVGLVLHPYILITESCSLVLLFLMSDRAVANTFAFLFVEDDGCLYD